MQIGIAINFIIQLKLDAKVYFLIPSLTYFMYGKMAILPSLNFKL